MDALVRVLSVPRGQGLEKVADQGGEGLRSALARSGFRVEVLGHVVDVKSDIVADGTDEGAPDAEHDSGKRLEAGRCESELGKGEAFEGLLPFSRDRGQVGEGH